MKRKRVYVVRTYVAATSVAQAARLARLCPPSDVFLEDTTSRNLVEALLAEHVPASGFKKKRRG